MQRAQKQGCPRLSDSKLAVTLGLDLGHERLRSVTVKLGSRV